MSNIHEFMYKCAYQFFNQRMNDIQITDSTHLFELLSGLFSRLILCFTSAF